MTVFTPSSHTSVCINPPPVSNILADRFWCRVGIEQDGDVYLLPAAFCDASCSSVCAVSSPSFCSRSLSSLFLPSFLRSLAPPPGIYITSVCLQASPSLPPSQIFPTLQSLFPLSLIFLCHVLFLPTPFNPPMLSPSLSLTHYGYPPVSSLPPFNYLLFYPYPISCSVLHPLIYLACQSRSPWFQPTCPLSYTSLSLSPGSKTSASLCCPSSLHPLTALALLCREQAASNGPFALPSLCIWYPLISLPYSVHIRLSADTPPRITTAYSSLPPWLSLSASQYPSPLWSCTTKQYACLLYALSFTSCSFFLRHSCLACLILPLPYEFSYFFWSPSLYPEVDGSAAGMCLSDADVSTVGRCSLVPASVLCLPCIFFLFCLPLFCLSSPYSLKLQ